MHSLSVRRLLVLASLPLALGACGDSTGSDIAARGDVAFSYSGAISGQFDASGGFRQSRGMTEFSAALVEGGRIELLAVDMTGTDSGDVFTLEAPALQRTTTCAEESDFFDCEVFATLETGVSERNETYDRAFVGFVGTVTVTEITEDRVRGSFSFTLEDIGVVGGAPTLEVRTGTFDVPVLDIDDVDAATAPALAPRVNAAREAMPRR